MKTRKDQSREFEIELVISERAFHKYKIFQANNDLVERFILSVPNQRYQCLTLITDKTTLLVAASREFVPRRSFAKQTISHLNF